MWIYEKKLQFPVNIKKSDPAMAKVIIAQLGGPDGELGASNRYLHQRYSMPYPEIKALLTDIGTEEMAHAEIIATMVHQLTKEATPNDFKKANNDAYYVDHTAGIYPQGANGMPFDAATFQSKGDPVTDLMEDMAAEQKARTTYENLMRLAKDPEVYKVLEFLRAREIVHFQRFGEALEFVRADLNCKNYYAYNPAFDHKD